MNLQQLLPSVINYLEYANLDSVPDWPGNTVIVHPLAQGEYNMNYLVTPFTISAV
jgi:hypothetical protein